VRTPLMLTVFALIGCGGQQGTSAEESDDFENASQELYGFRLIGKCTFGSHRTIRPGDVFACAFQTPAGDAYRVVHGVARTSATLDSRCGNRDLPRMEAFVDGGWLKWTERTRAGREVTNGLGWSLPEKDEFFTGFGVSHLAPHVAYPWCVYRAM
jgi:hypothetical protein